MLEPSIVYVVCTNTELAILYYVATPSECGLPGTAGRNDNFIFWSTGLKTGDGTARLKVIIWNWLDAEKEKIDHLSLQLCWLLSIVSASSESSEVYSMFYIYISRHHLYCFTLTERVITKRPIGTFQICFMILLSNSYLLSWLICKFAIKINEVITTTSTLEASIYIKYLTSNNQINRFNKK